jgi:hypothetical protein
MVIVAGLGRVAGAVYRPPEVNVPQSVPEQPGPVARHETAVFCVPETTARNCSVLLTATREFAGVTFIKSGRMMVAVAVADFELFAFDTAFTVICGGLGTVAGAV